MKFALETAVLVVSLTFTASALADPIMEGFSWGYDGEGQFSGTPDYKEVGETEDKSKHSSPSTLVVPQDPPPAAQPPSDQGTVEAPPPPPSDQGTVEAPPPPDQGTVEATPPPVVPVEDDPKPIFIPSKVDFPARMVVATVPEFDGSFAFLGFGLIAAFIALIRERRRTELS